MTTKGIVLADLATLTSRTTSVCVTLFVLAGFLLVRPAHADFVLTSQALPIIVRQNTTNNIAEIVISNTNAFDIVFTNILVLNPVANPFKAPDNDADDVALKPTLAAPDAISCQKGTVLAGMAPGGLADSCKFTETFATSDTRKPDPDFQPGVWNLQTEIIANQVGKVMNKDDQTISQRVTVTDVVAVPEPSFVGLYLSIIPLVVLYHFQRSMRKNG